MIERDKMQSDSFLVFFPQISQRWCLFCWRKMLHFRERERERERDAMYVVETGHIIYSDCIAQQLQKHVCTVGLTILQIHSCGSIFLSCTYFTSFWNYKIQQTIILFAIFIALAYLTANLNYYYFNNSIITWRSEF